MQEYSIERTGKADLAFTGEQIGQSNGVTPLVKIYRTKAGTFIATVRVDDQRVRAEHFEKPVDLIAWIQKNTGNFSSTSLTEDAQAAIEAAAKKDDSFKACWTERVE